MENVSRPLIALLIASVAALAVWMVALKPSSGGSGTSAAYQSAIAKARAAVSTSAAAGVAHGGTVATTPNATATPAAAATAASNAAATPARNPATAATHPATAATKPAAKGAAGTIRQQPVSPSLRLNAVTRALRANKVVALLFYNGAAADDRALKQELAAVPAHGKQVVKLAVPLSELTRYPVVTNQVPVEVSPTLVLVDGSHHASTIVGFADRFEIAQRVTDALTVK
jgi:type IV secretory pathway VirJ component